MCVEFETYRLLITRLQQQAQPVQYPALGRVYTNHAFDALAITYLKFVIATLAADASVESSNGTETP